MQKVFFKCNLEVPDTMPRFWSKLRSFVGDFTIEGMDYNNCRNDVVIISFYTDKIIFDEGAPKLVQLTATHTDTDWQFASITK